jgi:hypothetical protein
MGGTQLQLVWVVAKRALKPIRGFNCKSPANKSRKCDPDLDRHRSFGSVIAGLSLGEGAAEGVADVGIVVDLFIRTETSHDNRYPHGNCISRHDR